MGDTNKLCVGKRWGQCTLRQRKGMGVEGRPPGLKAQLGAEPESPLSDVQ